MDLVFIFEKKMIRDQECKVYRESGRKEDCSSWDFEEAQVSSLFKIWNGSKLNLKSVNFYTEHKYIL